ncbi:alginate biosynthesis protein AlgA [Oxobacter pfennigii]|uniref:mannose-1-phosphate guanylyltransferase n=1 Tax=Oxobacter pfennigii TaxID=36849 RepID=A0A0P8WZ14_9CLOT|nr:mannose-1-phosphate guanylyltransferase [Oxobacter pfennigii]KPU43679.1 alginate biosynthesis protein AlgA [Oxobacter pfennigii]
MIYSVIMAGGKGERFWPKSRRKTPKQLLCLTNDGKTMIQNSIDRVSSLCSPENTYIVTNKDYAMPINHQLPQIPLGNIVVEPFGKNTAACIGLAAIHIMDKDKDGVMVVLPSDHIIKNNQEFLRILDSATTLAEEGENIVTIGITPSYPETGYGYINFGEKACEKNNKSIYKVERFVEKPDIKKAEEYLESGKYLWNSGMFIWKVSTIMNNIHEYMPRLYEGLMRIKDSINTSTYNEVLYEEYSKFDSISIDYGIMERAAKIFTIPGQFGWDDVGTWTALERVNKPDDKGNIYNGNIVSIDTKDCIIDGTQKLIATVGVENLVIVDTDDAILVCSKDRCQDIKLLLSEMKELKRENYL